MNSEASTSKSLEEIVDELNNDAYREQFFADPGSFLENELKIKLTEAHKKEIESVAKYLKSQTPHAKFYLPGKGKVPEGAIGFI